MLYLTGPMKINHLNGRDIKALFFFFFFWVYKGIVGLKALAYNAYYWENYRKLISFEVSSTQILSAGRLDIVNFKET